MGMSVVGLGKGVSIRFVDVIKDTYNGAVASMGTIVEEMKWICKPIEGTTIEINKLASKINIGSYIFVFAVWTYQLVQNVLWCMLLTDDICLD